MKQFYLNVLATVTAAALVADVAMLFRFSERLTRIETRLDDKLGIKTTSKKNEPERVTVPQSIALNP